nr:hypothetical protein [Tanacetum cinerariifolium]
DENEVRFVDEMSGELGMVKSDVGKLCLERKELDEKFEEVSRVLAGLSAKVRVSVVIMETDALRKEVVNVFWLTMSEIQARNKMMNEGKHIIIGRMKSSAVKQEEQSLNMILAK